MTRTPVATADEQVFPEVERVSYGKTPLVEVICQVKFPADLRLEKEPPVDFQRRVRSMFPLLRQETRSVLTGLPPEAAKAFEGLVPPQGISTVWAFQTESGDKRLELARDNLTLITSKYGGWEDFYSAFRAPLDAFLSLYEQPFLPRIGLRYKDLIRRSTLGLNDSPWHQLLSPHVLAELADKRIAKRAVEARRTILLKLPEREAKVRIQHGFAEVQGSDEQCYLIDCDFFVERTEVSDADATLVYLHEHAGRLFRWCITDQLHRAMEPSPI